MLLPSKQVVARTLGHIDNNQYLEAAQDYAMRFGWTIIPIGAGGKTPPRGVKWERYQEGARPSDEEFRRWFSRGDVAGLAVIHRDGLCVRDFDDSQAYDHWQAHYPELAKSLPAVKTARGYHVYFRCPSAMYKKFGDGELRVGSGHYTIVPPSAHASGAIYQWMIEPNGDIPIIDDPKTAGLVPASDEHNRELLSKDRLPVTPLNPPLLSESDVSDESDMSDMSDVFDVSKLGLDEASWAAIKSTLPTAAGQRNRRIFNLVMVLRRQGFQSVQQCKPIVQFWHQRALPAIRTKNFLETWTDFLNAWENYDPEKEGRLGRAIAKATALTPPASIAEFQDELLNVVCCTCHVLAIEGKGRFWLSGRALALPLGVDHRRVYDCVDVLIFEGIIKVVQEHSPKRAREFEWLLPLGDEQLLQPSLSEISAGNVGMEDVSK